MSVNLLSLGENSDSDSSDEDYVPNDERSRFLASYCISIFGIDTQFILQMNLMMVKEIPAALKVKRNVTTTMNSIMLKKDR